MTDSSTHRAQANSFGAAAAQYESARPSYPDDAVDWMVPAGAARVVDLGAGTGKFTRSLVARGLDVVAVEPDATMRATLSALLPDVATLEGTAESIPVPDADVDLVTVAQAWHWVDQALAVPEVRRVLKPGGALAIVWNVRDERVDWVRALGEVIGNVAVDNAVERMSQLGDRFAGFEPTERFDTEWANDVDRAGLVTLVESRSYMITATPDVRAETLAAVQHLLDTDPALVGRERFPLPYRTFCFRAVAA